MPRSLFPALLLLAFFGSGACSVARGRKGRVEQRFEYAWPQMGATFKLVFYAPDSLLARQAAQAVVDRVDTLNAIMSDYRPDSELMRLCEQAGTGQKVAVSADLWRILHLSAGYARRSRGAFDPTIGPLTRLWRRARHLQELPDSGRIEEARALVNWENVILYRNPRRVELKNKGMKLDLGGIGQGFAADECLRVLRGFGITKALADAGGDIALGDPPPGARGWSVAIPGQFAQAPLLLSNCGITTSGATARYLEANGRRYSHIVDPRSGWGVSHRVLVTVEAPSATEADAWATAISVMGKRNWEAMKNRYPRVKVWVGELPLGE